MQNRDGREVALMLNCLVIYLKAGVPIVSALDGLCHEFAKSSLHVTLKNIARQIVQGNTFQAACANETGLFNQMQLMMIKTGEATGTLPECLQVLSDYESRRTRFQSRLISALVYPSFVMGLSFVVVAFLPPLICKPVLAMIAGTGVTLNPLTRAVAAASDLASSWTFWIIFSLLAIALWRHLSGPSGHRRLEAGLNRIPWLRKTLQAIRISRFARSLGCQLQVGLNPVQALGLAGLAWGSDREMQANRQARIDVEEGGTFHEALKQMQVFPPMFLSFVKVGEDTGKLSQLVLRLADYYEDEFEVRLEQALQLLEPACLILLGSVVGLIVLALALPLAQMLDIA